MSAFPAREFGLGAATQPSFPDSATATITAGATGNYSWTKYRRLVLIQNDLNSGARLRLWFNGDDDDPAPSLTNWTALVLEPGDVCEGIRGGPGGEGILIKHICIYSDVEVDFKTDFYIVGWP